MSRGDGAAPRNPGWAGETGDFDQLSESDVRGTEYVGTRALDGGHPGAAPSFPYQIARRDPDAPLFEGSYRERLDKILSRYPNKRGALLPVLNMAQEIRGHLSPEAMDRVADLLELSPAYVRGVVTFYTMYNRRPVGRYLIQVCTNVCCNICGADDVVAAFLEHTDTAPGEVSEDGLFTVMEVECLGACGFPTVVQINNRYYENVTAADVPGILDLLRSDGIPIPQSGEAFSHAARKKEAPEPAEGTEDPEASRESGAGEAVDRSPAVPPTEEGAREGGPAGERATGGSRPHEPEEVGE